MHAESPLHTQAEGRTHNNKIQAHSRKHITILAHADMSVCRYIHRRTLTDAEHNWPRGTRTHPTNDHTYSGEIRRPPYQIQLNSQPMTIGTFKRTTESHPSSE